MGTLMPVTLLILPWSLMIAARLMLRVAVLILLRLGAAFLIGLLVKGGDELLECSDEVDAEITFGFVGLFDRFRDILDGRGEALEGGIDALEAGGDAFEMFVEKFGQLVVF
jgi:hypothetical protein